jgi:hypothetical protein
MTGCSRETVTRALMKLKRGKVVTWNVHSLMLNSAALQRRPGAGLALNDVTEITRLV